jgi:DNA-binding LacI/PurR family transcriptional regulator
MIMKVPRTKSLTMEDVALRAGVSITTVSHVINKTRKVSHETMDIVLQAIKELNYQSAKFLKPKAEKEIYIGVIVADIREDYFIAMIKAVESVAADYGVSIIFCDSEADPVKEERNIKILLERNVNGLIVAPIEADHIPRILSKAFIPMVLIDRQYETHNYLFVGINNFHSAYMGTKYLFEKGGAQPGFIGYSSSIYTIRQRILGYKAALIEHGNAQPKILSLSYNRENSSPRIKQFIADEGLDSLMCGTSTICYEVINTLEEFEEDIRNSLKIITFDDNRWMDYLRYPVSVIVQPVAEISSAALENLLRMIDKVNLTKEVKRELLFDTSIIDRIK